MTANPPCYVIAYVNKINDAVFRKLTNEAGEIILCAFNDAGYKQLSLTQEDKILGYMVEAKWAAL
jgi:phosphoribosyl-ATP pyrophosphohydrolase